MSEASTETTHFLLVSTAVTASNNSGMRLETVTGRVGIVFTGPQNTDKQEEFLGRTNNAICTSYREREAEEVSIRLVTRTTAHSSAILAVPVCLPDCTNPWQAGD